MQYQIYLVVRANKTCWHNKLSLQAEQIALLKSPHVGLEFERDTCFYGLSYSQKFHVKCGFSNLTNDRTSQFMFRKYLLGTENVKMEKQTLEMRKVTKKT